MSYIKESTRNGQCGICLNDFMPEERPLTHEGADHAGFHPICLEGWRNSQTSHLFDRDHYTFPCPYDQIAIDSDSLSEAIHPVSRTLHIMRKFRKSLINAGLAAGIGGAAAYIGTVAAGGILVGGAIPVGLIMGSAVGLRAMQVTWGAIAVGSLGAVAAGVARLRAGGWGTGAAVAIAGLKATKLLAEFEPGTVILGVALATIETAVGAAGSYLFTRTLHIHPASKENIYNGVLISLALYPIIAMVSLNFTPNILVAGAIAGGLTMLRR